MTSKQVIADFAAQLHKARLARTTVTPLRSHAELTIDDAYQISLKQLELRLTAGEKLVGKKIGVTSKPVQNMLGVHEPDFGFLTGTMQIENGKTVRIADTLIQPRAEAEIALILRSDLKGPGITPEDVRNALEAIAPCIEVVDSRIADWDIKIVDTVADNASCGVFVVGALHTPANIDLAALHGRMFKNDMLISEGYGSAVQGSPLASTAWLANTLGRYDVPLLAGDVILSGSLVPLEPIRAGDRIRVEFDRIGNAEIGFS